MKNLQLNATLVVFLLSLAGLMGCAEDQITGTPAVQTQTDQTGTTPQIPEVVMPVPETDQDNEDPCVDADQDGAFAMSDGCKEGTDCDDTNSTIYPGAPEICGDGIDQSCSSSDKSCGCVDQDGDGAFAIGDDCPEGTDCDDLNSWKYPGNKEICGDGLDQDCSGEDLVCACIDGDSDGYDGKTDDCPQGKDCDDTNKNINPGATDTCGDGIDQDCQAGDAPCVCIDEDGDGYGEGPNCLGKDCYDNNDQAYEGAPEICGDGIDQDCDGADEACPLEECTEDTDGDNDGFGTASGCEEIDCADGDPTTYPGAPEICGDGIDQNCDGADELCPEVDCIDADGDGYGVGEDCLGLDCGEGDPNVNPGEVEICGDGLDNDCLDGDLPCPDTCIDNDDDGFFAISDECDEGTDCNDENAEVKPGADEICGDGLDNDCVDGDQLCPDGFCEVDGDCDSGQWCDTLAGECIFPKAWHYWAPTVYLDTNETANNPEVDYFTNADFDGDWVLGNNKDNADFYYKKLHVYYSFVKTDTHWYLGYHFYFPERWSVFGAFGNQYENLIRSVLLVVRQDGGFGVLEAMETSTENSLYRYVAEDSEISGVVVDGTIITENSSGHARPVVFIDDQTHNIRGDYEWIDDGFPGDNGLIVRWSFVPSLPQDALVGEFTYSLLENKGELWSRRNDIGDTQVFESFGLFAGDDANNDSRAPWAIKDGAIEPGARAGELLWDPATLIRRHLPVGWGEFSSQYTYNPYAHRVDLIDLLVYEDTDPFPGQGGSDPYVNLYMRDGVGNQHKLLGEAGGVNGNWKETDADTDNGAAAYAFKAGGLLERYWFYGVDTPDVPIAGIQVRDDDGVGDDWLMDPEETYNLVSPLSDIVDFVLSDMMIEVSDPIQ